MKIYICGDGKIPAKKNRMRMYGGRMIKDKEVHVFESTLRLLAIREMHTISQEVIDTPVRMDLIVTFGDKRRRDLQNLFGSVCDAINGVVYTDDSQIQEIYAMKKYEPKKWSYQIIITTL